MKMNYSLNQATAQDPPVPAFHHNSPEAPLGLRCKLSTLASCLFAALLAAGCASTKVTDRQELVTDIVPRPAHIWVYDFVATPADVPADSVLAGEPNLDKTPQTAEQIAEGKKLGAQIASELVAQIRAMGMPAEQACGGHANRSSTTW